MTEPEWLNDRNIFEMFLFLQGKQYARKWDLFCCHCLRRVWDILQDHRIQAYVEVRERAAEGTASGGEVEAAWSACETAFEEKPHEFPYNWFRQAFTEYPMQFDPYDVAKACREAVGVVAAEAIRPSANVWTDEMTKRGNEMYQPEEDEQDRLVKEVFGNPFSPVTVDPSWLTSTVVALAEGIYQERAFDRMPILADALQDAGCDTEDVLSHCRQPGEHVRGCWLIDLLTGRK